MARKFLIDTDMGSDDAAALIMALRHPDVEVAAITVVSGNMPIEQGVINALYTTQICNKAIPVYAGSARPLLREPSHAEWFHGEDGFGDMGYPAPKHAPEEKGAVDAIIDTVKANEGLTIVTLGPLTNLALAVKRLPEIAGMIERCVVMGGAACTEGNVTPAAEYNIWVDPEAARIVFNSGLPIEMIGWEHSRGRGVLDEADMAHIRGIGTELAQFLLDSNRVLIGAFKKQTGEAGITLPDAVTMAIAIDPAVCLEKQKHWVDIETHSELTRGMTVVDRLGVAGDERNHHTWKSAMDSGQNVSICWAVDFERYRELLFAALK